MPVLLVFSYLSPTCEMACVLKKQKCSKLQTDKIVCLVVKIVLLISLRDRIVRRADRSERGNATRAGRRVRSQNKKK